MNLRDYFQGLSRHDRVALRKRMAVAHGVAEVTVRSWINGYRRHPCQLEAIRITESMTGWQVTRHDLRPEIFGKGSSLEQFSSGG